MALTFVRRMAVLMVVALTTALASVTLSPPAAQAAATDRSECQNRTTAGKERYCTEDRTKGGTRVQGYFSWFYRDGGPKESTGQISFWFVKPSGCDWARFASHSDDTGEDYWRWYSSCDSRNHVIGIGGDEAQIPRNGYVKFSVCGSKSGSDCRTVWIQKTQQRAPF